MFGILAFEYLKSEPLNHCLLVVLSSPPTCVPQVDDEVNQLIQKIQRQQHISDTHIANAFRIAKQWQCRYDPNLWRGPMPQREPILRSLPTMWPDTGIGSPRRSRFCNALHLRMEGCVSIRHNGEVKACAHHGLLEPSR